MLAFFKAVDMVLNIKLVQWLMLAWITLMLVFYAVFTIKYNKLRLENAIIKSDNAQVTAGLQVQNRAIEEMGKAFQLKEKNLNEANKRATQVAIETKKELKRVNALYFKKGATCEEKVKAVFSFISSSR